jgi:hypothetical protein
VSHDAAGEARLLCGGDFLETDLGDGRTSSSASIDYAALEAHAVNVYWARLRPRMVKTPLASNKRER